MTDDGATLRIDKWLWHARFAKTRSLAARLCTLGAVELGGRPVAKPNQAVRIGSQITVVHGRQRRRVEVLGLGTRRGPATEAQMLYRELAPPEPLTRIPDDWEPLLAEDESFRD
ncbi:RNA-binding protein S4 [Aliidongia dinghuensis]|uniref:RNA-binding protein S4 n=1 Tax=Aliidongia dinghuensis TaxID=1867774 RepID=A0A8J2YWW1_9PROT|nr:RNA-binding S4 domain-containing protein [Aliidongia dinghuensis]GGF33589.1 RNA-binding protein S4 [Aliidongia dinghuensis]